MQKSCFIISVLRKRSLEINNHQVALLESAQDLVNMMGWEEKSRPPEMIQGILPVRLTEPEQRIMDLLKEREQMHIDVINAISGFPNSLKAGALLQLEMKDLICRIPVRMYRLKSL